MKIIISIGIGLILSLPQIISIIIRGGRQSPSQILRENMKYDKDDFININKIAIVAGSSTPKNIIEEVKEYFEK